MGTVPLVVTVTWSDSLIFMPNSLWLLRQQGLSASKLAAHPRGLWEARRNARPSCGIIARMIIIPLRALSANFVRASQPWRHAAEAAFFLETQSSVQAPLLALWGAALSLHSAPKMSDSCIAPGRPCLRHGEGEGRAAGPHPVTLDS